MSDAPSTSHLKLLMNASNIRPLVGPTRHGLGELRTNAATRSVHGDSVCSHLAVLMNADMLIELEAKREIAEIDKALTELQHLMENDR